MLFLLLLPIYIHYRGGSCVVAACALVADSFPRLAEAAWERGPSQELHGTHAGLSGKKNNCYCCVFVLWIWMIVSPRYLWWIECRSPSHTDVAALTKTQFVLFNRRKSVQSSWRRRWQWQRQRPQRKRTAELEEAARDSWCVSLLFRMFTLFVRKILRNACRLKFYAQC